jgi:hypothetical protein
MYGTPAITCFKYQVVLYGKTPHYRQPSPTLYGSITFTIPILKNKGETCMVQEPSHVKQLSPIHV